VGREGGQASQNSKKALERNQNAGQEGNCQKESDQGGDLKKREKENEVWGHAPNKNVKKQKQNPEKPTRNIREKRKVKTKKYSLLHI